MKFGGKVALNHIPNSNSKTMSLLKCYQCVGFIKINLTLHLGLPVCGWSCRFIFKGDDITSAMQSELSFCFQQIHPT